MDTHRLRYFLSIAEEGSINRAASVLGVAQPALSRQVRLLEEELGITLFRRTSRGVRLTDGGERLRAMTAGPLRQLELAMRYAGSPLARIERGLSIGLPPTAADLLAVPLLHTLGVAFPEVAFSLTVASHDALFKEMLRGSIDVAVTAPTADDRLFYGEVLTEGLVAVGGAESPLAPDSPIGFGELMARKLILPVSRTGIRATIENTALRLKHIVRCGFTTDSLHVMRDMAASGYGYAVLPLTACSADVDAGRLRYAPVIDPVLTQALGVTVSPKTGLSRGVTSKLSEIVRDEAMRLTGPRSGRRR